jgi:hypothetical protein
MKTLQIIRDHIGDLQKKINEFFFATAEETENGFVDLKNYLQVRY